MLLLSDKIVSYARETGYLLPTKSCNNFVKCFSTFSNNKSFRPKTVFHMDKLHTTIGRT